MKIIKQLTVAATRSIPAGAVILLIGFSSGGMASAQEDNSASAPTFSQCACRGVMSPTQVANAFWEELSIQPNPDHQVNIVSKYLEMVKMDTDEMPDSRLDRLALGEGAFLTFQVQPAHDYFATLLDGDDLIAQHAWDRMMQIQFRALENFEEARTMVDQFHQKFPPSELNSRGRYQQVVNFVNQYLKDGNRHDAVALIIAELGTLPTDSPYQSYSLLPRFSDVIAASPRQPDIRKLVADKLAGLKKLKRRWAHDTFPATDDPILRGDMPAWYWRAQNIGPGKSLRAARQRELEDLIASVEKWLKG